jgi:hypothetical protein
VPAKIARIVADVLVKSSDGSAALCMEVTVGLMLACICPCVAANAGLTGISAVVVAKIEEKMRKEHVDLRKKCIATSRKPIDYAKTRASVQRTRSHLIQQDWKQADVAAQNLHSRTNYATCAWTPVKSIQNEH